MIRRAACLAWFVAAFAWSQAAAPDPAAQLQSAMAAEKAGRTDAAVRQFRAILRVSPSREIEGQARLELVRIYERRAQWWDAAEQLEALRKLAPKDAEYAYQLGITYRSLSKQAFETMRASAPDSARLQQLMGEQFAIAGDSAKATAAYERAIAADPKLSGSHLALAMLHLRAGKLDLARAEIDKELAIAPESAIARQMRDSIARGPQ